METALVIGGAFITGSVNALGKADEKTPINDSYGPGQGADRERFSSDESQYLQSDECGRGR
jgi:hypothetical protein